MRNEAGWDGEHNAAVDNQMKHVRATISTEVTVNSATRVALGSVHLRRAFHNADLCLRDDEIGGEAAKN